MNLTIRPIFKQWKDICEKYEKEMKNEKMVQHKK